MNRSQKERMAANEGSIYEKSVKWHSRFSHVFACPNTLRHERLLNELLETAVVGRRVLDIGCGCGDSSQRIRSFGAEYVFGIDVSDKFISVCKKYEEKGKLEFLCHDVMEPLPGNYDVIFGRAILHHLDYRQVLRSLYNNNLKAGGVMIFMEPLGSNLLIRIYHQFSKSAHTINEKPFFRNDLQWLKSEFRHVEIIPINYFSLLFGILSTSVFSTADNSLMQLSDRVDIWLAKRFKSLVPNYRQAILCIKK